MGRHNPITSTDDILEDIYQELVAIRKQGEKEPEKVPPPSDKPQEVKLTGIKELEVRKIPDPPPPPVKRAIKEGGDPPQKPKPKRRPKKRK